METSIPQISSITTYPGSLSFSYLYFVIYKSENITPMKNVNKANERASNESFGIKSNNSIPQSEATVPGIFLEIRPTPKNETMPNKKFFENLIAFSRSFRISYPLLIYLQLLIHHECCLPFDNPFASLPHYALLSFLLSRHIS